WSITGARSFVGCQERVEWIRYSLPHGSDRFVRRWLLEQPLCLLGVRLPEGEGAAVRPARGEPAREGAKDAGVPGEVAHGARSGAGARGVPAVRVERHRRVPGGDVRAAALPGDAAGRA